MKNKIKWRHGALPHHSQQKMTTMGIKGPCLLQQENGDHHDGGKWSSLPFVTKRWQWQGANVPCIL
jgi:hypothetical protein